MYMLKSRRKNLSFFSIFAKGQQRPNYEDYHNAKLSILHSVFQVGGYLEEFLNLEMVNIKKNLLALIIGKLKTTY